MVDISSINFTAQTQAEKPKKQKKDVVYVSKNPDAAVNATGVIAGTSGMVGGAVVGGLVGAAKLPGYIVKDVLKAPELTTLAEILKEVKSPEAVEEVIEIMKTMVTRLDSAFKDDAAAKSVVNKVFDPIIHSVSLRKNTKNLGQIIKKHLLSLIQPQEPIMMGMSEAEQSAAKKMFKPLRKFLCMLLGTPNSHTSKAIGGLTGNIAEAISQTVENIKNFTPEERAAWGRVTDQIKEELKNNPKLKLTNGLSNALGEIIHGIKGANRRFGFSPAATIGKWSAIGAVFFGTLSTLGWFGLKKSLMTKENEKTIASQA